MSAVQSAIQFKGRADQRKMSECLRKIPEMLAGGTEFFGVESKVIGIPEHFVEQKSRFINVTALGQAFDEPE